ncbi:MAG: hypothetical protein IT330_17060 [Anaerolineae bacterium]|nr:hypothetical protein [Anaerolineae bacterium]
MRFPLDDYMDSDVAYLVGLITARGTIMETSGVRQLTIEFPYSSLEAQGISSTFDQETAIRLGLNDIRERLLDLLDTDISIIRREGGVDFVIRFMRNSMIWRNILLLTAGAMSYPYFRVPDVFFDESLPKEWQREFVRGYADVAGNIRHANRYVDGRHRVRLDVLNYPVNWEVPVQLCTLLQEHLDVPVQLITWGHPNLGRDFREHQINIFARPFLKVGFSFEHKQKILEEFVAWDAKNTRDAGYDPCPGIRHIHDPKPHDPRENSRDRLDTRLVGNHYNAYWQICKALGCTRVPPAGTQLSMEFVEDTDPGSELR